jgi:MFS-type transporter involved in bile tolerance (Atg22 family)
MQSSLSTYKPITSTPHNLTQQADIARSNAISGLLVILFVVVVGAIVGYQKHRSTIMQQRIQHLNRIWQLDPKRKPSY